MKTPSYEEISRNINRHYNRVFWLIVHITLVVVAAEILWMSDPTPQNGNPWLTIPWFGLVLIHAVEVVMDILKERALKQAWQRSYGTDEAHIADEEKPKRLARLMDEREHEDESSYRQNGHSSYPDQTQKD